MNRDYDAGMARSIPRLVVILSAWIALCAPSVVAAGPFDKVDLLDSDFVRGQSTLEDVRRVFGKPDGKGGGRLPPDWASQEIWFYEEQVVHGNRWNPETRNGKVEIDAELRQLFIFFTGDRFDGYLWYGLRVDGADLP